MALRAVADQFFWLAHDDWGRTRLAQRPVALGLSAALLGELVFGEQVWIKDGHLSVRAGRTPSDALAHTVLDQIAAQPAVTDVRTWLLFVARTAQQDVLRRLWRAGWVRMEQSRRVWRRRSTTKWVPTDINVAATAEALLSTRLRRMQPLAPQEMFLTALCRATGLDQVLLDGAPGEVHDYAAHVSAVLWPPARELADGCSTAVADAILSAR
jgi:hypothetical protein